MRDETTRVMVQVYQAYEEQCQREGVVDFAELLLRTYELLRDNQALREHYQRRFSHILVDEFQDTNKLQYAWLKMFAGPVQPGGCAVFAVGDDDQSIYAFRGAQVGNMSAFEREFKVEQVIKLERNYRSFGNILDAANELISHNERRLGKNLSTEAGPGEPVRVYEATSDFAEAQWFVDEAQQLHRDGTARSHIALALPQQCAEPRDRECAVQRRHALQGVRRAALLRACRGQACVELPAAHREPERRHQLPARGELPDPWHRRAQRRAAAGRGPRQRPQPGAERGRGARQGAAATCRPSWRSSMRCATPPAA